MNVLENVMSAGLDAELAHAQAWHRMRTLRDQAIAAGDVIAGVIASPSRRWLRAVCAEAELERALYVADERVARWQEMYVPPAFRKHLQSGGGE